MRKTLDGIIKPKVWAQNNLHMRKTHDGIITPNVWAHKTSLTPPLFFIEVTVQRQECERSCICDRQSTLSLSKMFFWNF